MSSNQISVVICAKNSGSTIERALKSIKKNTPKEIIVVYGESTDATVQIAAKYTASCYFDEKKGLAYARQLGANYAKGKYVAYLEADIELPDCKLLENMLNELIQNGWAAIHSQLIDPSSEKNIWQKGEDFHFRNTFNRPGEHTFLGTTVCIIRKDILNAYRFDSSFKGAAEDADLYHRLLVNNFKFGVSNQTAFHYHRSSFESFKKQRIWYGYGNAHMLLKHKSFQLLFSPFGIAVYGIVKCFQRNKLEIIPFYLTWAFFLFYGTIKGLFSFKLTQTQ
jgi:glycosyltransferase involved in cell wall biosynthesis